MKLLLYCTKAKPYLYFAQESRTLMEIDNSFEGYKITNKNVDDYLNGKIVAECDFEVEEIKPEKYWHSTEDFDYIYNTGTIYYEDLLKKSCLMDYELDDYLGCEDKGYAIHIKNLHIFDKLRELSDYLNNKYWNSHFGNDSVSKAPQNMMRVYKLKDIKWEEYILISIQPQWLCKILNGEKTIEVRKKILKEMIK